MLLSQRQHLRRQRHPLPPACLPLHLRPSVRERRVHRAERGIPLATRVTLHPRLGDKRGARGERQRDSQPSLLCCRRVRSGLALRLLPLRVAENLNDELVVALDVFPERIRPLGRHRVLDAANDVDALHAGLEGVHHLQQRDPQRVHIHLLVIHAARLELGREVGVRPDRARVLRERRRILIDRCHHLHCPDFPSDAGGVFRGARSLAREAKIAKLRNEGAVDVDDEDVVGFDVTVDVVLRVHMHEAFGGVEEVLLPFLLRETFSSQEQLPQRSSAQLHLNVQPRPFPAHRRHRRRIATSCGGAAAVQREVGERSGVIVTCRPRLLPRAVVADDVDVVGERREVPHLAVDVAVALLNILVALVRLSPALGLHSLQLHLLHGVKRLVELLLHLEHTPKRPLT
mmetsp:Transcript_18975/g.45769  ORF Transcript_18975/g.45769 Transcript_18975/m.45769 type:complete len:401 (+) Transcript_18975:617-1819(+)